MQTIQTVQVKRERESIHSGQFMVSHFEAEEQDDEDEVAVPIPEEGDAVNIVPVKELLEPGGNCGNVGGIGGNSNSQFVELLNMKRHSNSQQQLSIDTSLAKLFQCMSLAYRQKLTSPKWNRFRGIRLRWKDKIRLNNVIWRCWHMQFIKKKNTFVCQFASPLDVDTHNKPEAIVLEGKYWKRKLAAVTAEYKKWRMFYSRHHSFGGHSVKDDVEMLNDTDLLNWNSQSNENVHMMVDEDYMGLMSDTLFSTITNQPFVFPDSREIAKAGLADFIQPSLGPLQPNLDDYMDTFEPLQEFVAGKLPTVPEEQTHATTTTTWNYSDLDLISNTNLQLSTMQPVVVTPTPPPPPPPPPLPPPVDYHTADNQLFTNQLTQQQSVYHGVVQSTKSQSKSKRLQQQQQQIHLFDKAVYTTNYPSVNEQIQQLPSQTQQQLVMVQSPQISPSPSNDLQQFDPTVVTASTTSTGTTANILNDVGYKFTNTSIQNIKFTSQVPPTTPPPPPPPYHMSQPISVYPQYDTMRSLLKDDKIETHEQSQRNSNRNSHNNSGNIRIKQRSRSNTREVQKRPPLISAISDPSLLSQKNSLLLTQLLGNSNSGSSNNDNSLFNRNQIQIKEENSNSMPILPQQQQQQTTTLIITTPCVNTVQTTVNNDPLSFSSSNSPILETSQPNINSPTSSQGSLGSPGRDHTPTHRDQRRVGHIHAEQKRRYNIKNGFDMIHSLIPHLNQNPNAKLSKATMLQKGAEYIRQLRSERNQLNEEMECLRQQIETLNTSISNCQSMLPATGAPVSRKRDSKMQEMFDDYVRKRTMEDWKYYIFSLLFRPLLDSFNTFVSTSSLEDLYRSTMLWIEQHCTLGDLRRVVLNSLKYLSTKTEILTEPERLPDEARQLVMTTTTTNPNN